MGSRGVRDFKLNELRGYITAKMPGLSYHEVFCIALFVILTKYMFPIHKKEGPHFL